MLRQSPIAVVLVTHAPLGKALYACAEHVLQTPPALLVADVLPADLPQPWVKKLVHEIAELNTKKVLLLCDLYGSTPYHIATGVQRRLSLRDYQVHLVSGVNVSMVLKALTDAGPSVEDVVTQVLAATQRGIVHQSPTLS
ncbi:PTS sugar transporter subunit IIA [Paenalcaligenes hominis]|uniref:PTS sugar transporter subunit IIA n=1 Tax=Paenalcaligenes hominis TaxID=643674 RepID=UPI003523D65E